MTRREAITTVVLALVAGGTAFFGSTWDSGFMAAAHVAGTAFFGTLSALLVALGLDPRRKQGDGNGP